jgi:3-hydroxy-9,10-secoandrosta-1,3,5(10)-triene-9,17-dione monooxygenase
MKKEMISQQSERLDIPSADDLISRAKSLIPVLRERARDCEAKRQMSQETLDDFLATGIFNVCKPKEYGGYEMGWDVLCAICMELAKGCGSSAWVYAVLAEHNHTIATYPLQAQLDVWGENPDTLVASGNSPGNTLTPVEGGWTINGRLNYSSGCDFADWHLTGEIIDGTPHKVLIRQIDCEIIDNWHVTGLAGTGSKDIDLVDVFIPEHRSISVTERGPRFDEAAVFRLPQWSVNPFDLASVTVGVAEGALEMFTAEMRERQSRFGDQISEFQSLQMRIGESAAELHAARLMILNDLMETMEILENLDELPIEIRARNKRDMAYAPLLAARAMDRIYYASGTAVLFESNDLQRCFRDVHAGTKQVALNFDINATTYGKVALGLDPAPVRW